MFYILVCVVIISVYLVNKLTCGLNRSSTCLLGKTSIVTGGNSGIGYEVCLDLASRGCKVIIADKDDASAACQNIAKETGNPQISYKHLDLASFKSIRKFASEINASEEKLHILVNNAGIGSSPVSATEDNLPVVMQVNYFGPFLLTYSLLELLKKSAPSRIVFTSSGMSFFTKLTEETLLSFDQDCYWSHPYSVSKLATIMASDILTDNLKNSGVTSNCLHPGCVRTPIFNKITPNLTPKVNIGVYLLKILTYMFGKDAWQGSQTTTYLAVSKDVENVTGQFFADCKAFFKPSQAHDKELCRKIWKATEKYIGLSK